MFKLDIDKTINNWKERFENAQKEINKLKEVVHQKQE